MGPIENKSTLVQLMAWRRTGDKPLLASILTQFTDAYMWHGNWSKRRQTETSTTKTSTNQNIDKPKHRQTKTLTNQNVDKPKRWQTKTSTNQNVDRPKRPQTETSTNQNVDKPKCWQTETSTINFSTLYAHMYIWLDVLHISVPITAWFLRCTLYISCIQHYIHGWCVIVKKAHSVHAFVCSNCIYIWSAIASLEVIVNNDWWYLITGNALNMIQN